MLINIVIDFLIGLVPLAGDLADAVYKCNSRNAVLLERHLRDKGAKALKAQNAESATQHNVNVGEDFDRYESGVVDNAGAGSGQELQTMNQSNQMNSQRGRSERGWFGNSRNRGHDLEQGRV